MSDIDIVPAQIEKLERFEQHAGMLKWVSSVDHKQIAVMYMLTSLFFFLVGGVEALLMRWQLAKPQNHFLTPEAYNQLFTLHGTTMIFLVAVPALLAFGNYFIPLQIGASDIAFPRLNAMSYWLFLFGGVLLYGSILAGNAPDMGWFSYAPLSEKPYSSLGGVDYWALGLLVIGIGTVSTAINFLVTIAALRAPGMSFKRLPLFTWMSAVNSFLIILAFPALNSALFMLLIDRNLHGRFFTPDAGGSPLLWQHIFWNFGHPEVYIMILPAFGIISEVIPVFSRQPIFGYGFVAGSTVAIGLLSFAVWAHHMFATGMGHDVDVFFAAGSAGMMFAFIGVHLYLVLYNGISEPPKAGVPVDPKTYRRQYKELVTRNGVPFWPDAAWRDALFGSLVIAGVVTLAFIYGAPHLAPPPNPTLLNAEPRPDWYLLWYFAILAMSPHQLESGIMILAPAMVFGSMFALPFFFNSGERSMRRRPWAVAWVTIVVVGVCTLWYEGKVSPWSPRFNAPPLPASVTTSLSPSAQRGALLFHDKRCESCHMIEGYGGLRGPDLSRAANRLTREQMEWRILNGGHNMPSFAGILKPEEVDDLLSFLHTRDQPSGTQLGSMQP